MATLLYFTLVDRNVRDGTNRNVNAQSSSNGHSFNFVLGNLLSQGISFISLRSIQYHLLSLAFTLTCVRLRLANEESYSSNSSWGLVLRLFLSHSDLLQRAYVILDFANRKTAC